MLLTAHPLRSVEEVGLPCHVVMDVETTGLSPQRGGRIVEIAAIAVEEGLVVAEFSSLVSIDRPIPLPAQRIHGITNLMLVGQPAAESVMPRFLDFAAGSVVVGHNIQFDVNFVRHELARLGFRFDNRTICTLKMSRKCFPMLPDHKLSTVARHVFGRSPAGHSHRALEDARLTARLWMAMQGMR